MKKNYKIRMVVTMIGTINVLADDKETAEKIAYNQKLTTSKLKNFHEDWIEIIETKEIKG